MNYDHKTKDQLILEITMLKQHVSNIKEEKEKLQSELEKQNEKKYAATDRIQAQNAIILSETIDITERKQVEDEIKKNQQRQAIVNALLRITMQDVLLNTLLKNALREILSIRWLTIERKGGIFLKPRESEFLEMAVHHGLEKQFLVNCASVPMGKCLCGKAAKTRSIIYAKCIDDRHEICVDDGKDHGHYCIPILSGDLVLGVLVLFIEKLQSRNEEDEEFLKTIGNTLAGMIERKMALDSTFESEQRFRQFADNVGEVFWVTNRAQNDILYVNNAFTKVFQKSLKSLIKNPNLLHDMVHPDDKEIFEINVENADSGNDFEYRIILPNDQIRWIRCRMSPIRNKRGEIFRIAGLATDITSHKEAAEKEQVLHQQLIQADNMTSLGALVTGIAHEINNPNNFVMLNAPILKEAWNSITPILEEYYNENGDFVMGGIKYSFMKVKINDLFNGIFEGAKRIKRIVADLKDFSREESSQNKKTIDMNEVVKSAISLLDNHIKKSTKNFKTDFYENSLHVHGSYQKLKQVIINLVQNACDALTDYTQSVIIKTGFNKEKNLVVVSVRDEGIGIEQKYINRITDPFYTTKRDIGGIGLGLSVSSGIVKDHNGKLTFSSNPNKGTISTISLPKERSINEYLFKT